MGAPSRSPARISSKPGSISVGTSRPSRAMSIVCWVRSRRVPTARSTWRLASCAPRARAWVRPRAVSATGRDGLLLSTLAALATDSACRAKTNRRSTSAGIAGLLPLVPMASGGHLGTAQIALEHWVRVPAAILQQGNLVVASSEKPVGQHAADGSGADVGRSPPSHPVRRSKSCLSDRDASALYCPRQALEVLLHLPPCAVGVSCPDQCQQSVTRTDDDFVRRWPNRDYQLI